MLRCASVRIAGGPSTGSVMPMTMQVLPDHCVRHQSRARRDSVTLTHSDRSGPMRVVVPLGTAISPGDTVLVGERWF